MRIALVLALLCAPAAYACGGFFCGGTQIDQSSERIIFAVRANTVEAHVQIFYSGAAQKFSWVVPVEALPALSVGSPAFFSWLDGQTASGFNLQWHSNVCNGVTIYGPGGGYYEGGTGGGAGGSGGA